MLKRRLSRGKMLLFAAPFLVLALLFGIAQTQPSDPELLPKSAPRSRVVQPVVKPVTSQFGDVTALAFSPNGQLLASANGGSLFSVEGSEVAVWSTRKGVLKVTYKIAGKAFPSEGVSGRGRVNSLCFSPDGKSLALGGDTRQYTPVAMPDGRRGFRESSSGIIEIVAAKMGQLQRSTPIPIVVRSVAFSPDGKLLAAGAGAGSGEVRMLDAQTGQLKWLVSGRGGTPDYSATGSTFTSNPQVESVAFSPDGKTLATIASLYGLSQGTSGIHFWDAQAGKLKFATPDGTQGYASASNETFALAFSPRQPLLAINRLGNSLKRDGVTLWNSTTGTEARQLSFPDADVVSVTFSPDGKTVAAAGGVLDLLSSRPFRGSASQGQVMLWDVTTGNVIATFNPPLPILSLAFSPDGKTLATGSKAQPWGEIKLWNLAALLKTARNSAEK